MNVDIELIGKGLIVLELLLFVIIYLPKSTDKTAKEKSHTDVGFFKRAMPLVQLGIGIFVVYSLVYVPSSPLLWVGLAIATIGISLIFWAKKTLGRNFSACVDMYVPFEVVKDGPYARIRHPIYTGNLIFLVGLSIACASIPLFLIFVYFIYLYNKSAAIEEAELSAQHPSYLQHVSTTGRFLPRLFK